MKSRGALIRSTRCFEAPTRPHISPRTMAAKRGSSGTMLTPSSDDVTGSGRQRR